MLTYIFLKLEYFNPTRSYKDRMAVSIIEAAEKSGKLKKWMNTMEASGGSTTSLLAFVCAVKGYNFRIGTSTAFAPEILQIMAAFGAPIDLIGSLSGQVSKNLIPSMIERANSLAKLGDTYLTDQFGISPLDVTAIVDDCRRSRTRTV